MEGPRYFSVPPAARSGRAKEAGKRASGTDRRYHVDKKATTVRLISQSVIAHHTPTC